MNAYSSASIVDSFFSINAVLAMSTFAQVSAAVIQRISVDMIGVPVFTWLEN